MQSIHKLITYCAGAVWLANGLLCKVLNLVPRHQEIVARILGAQFSRTVTILIGLSEIIMAIWILSRFKSRLNALTQIVIVVTMNLLEFFLAADLLLWGKWNLIFALVFVLIVYLNEFYLSEKNLP